MKKFKFYLCAVVGMIATLPLWARMFFYVPADVLAASALIAIFSLVMAFYYWASGYVVGK